MQKYNTTSNIKLAFFLNLFFTVFEIIGGIYTNSLAILSDALHDFGDSISLSFSWFLENKSQKTRDHVFSYGYKRLSLLSALITGIILLSGSLYVISQAVVRMMNPEHSNASGMILFALIGILVNGIAAFRTSKGKNMNQRMISWHFIEDILGWVAILVISIIIAIKDLHILDPVLSLMIALYILWNVFRNLKKSLILFLQGVPENFNSDLTEQTIKKLNGVISVHDIHAWSLDGENNILTAHVVVKPDLRPKETFDLKCKIKELMYKMNLQHSTLEIEHEGESCELNGH